MNNRIQKAVYAIPVPAGLSARVLAACQTPTAKAPAPLLRFVPAAVTAAACAAVLLVTLLSTGQMPGAKPPVAQPEPPALPAVPEQGETSTSTTAMTELATEPGVYTTTKNNTTRPASSTTQKEVYPHLTGGLVVGTTSGAQAPSTSVLKSTRTTWKGTTTSSANHAACQLAIPGRFVVLSQQELEAHYGRRFLPTRLPADMVQPEIYVERGIYHKDEAMIAERPDNWAYLLKQGIIRDAAVIFDENNYQWHSLSDTGRNLSVSVSTAPYPNNRLGDLSRFDETLTVAGVTVKLHHYDDSPYTDTWCYSALAEVDGVAFYVSAWEFTREEFLDTLASMWE